MCKVQASTVLGRVNSPKAVKRVNFDINMPKKYYCRKLLHNNVSGHQRFKKKRTHYLPWCSFICCFLSS